MDKMSMSLDDIVKISRAAKQPTTGGKAKKDKGARATPYSKGGSDAQKKDKQPKKDKEPNKKDNRPERAPAEPSTEVIVGNLPFTIDAADVEAHLSAVAPCTVELKMRQRGSESKPAGVAIATFESIESATKAVKKLNESELGGRNIMVRFSRPEASDTAPKKEKSERAPAEPSTEVFVGKLPLTIDSAAVEAHLSAVAPCTVDLKMRQRGGESKPAGFAIATFESIESATKAVNELNESELEGRKIVIRFATTA